jgi:hypothetical protein
MFRLALPVFACLCLGSTNLGASIIASSTYTVTPLAGGEYQYDLTLNNTGTTTIGTFWFAWIPGAGFLSAAPTSVVGPSGWTEALTNGNSAILWTTTTPLAAGGSVSGFQFISTETPTEMMGVVPSGLGAGDPVTTSFVYIQQAFGDPGYEFASTAAGGSTTPEPSTFALSMILAIAFAVRSCKFASRR